MMTSLTEMHLLLANFYVYCNCHPLVGQSIVSSMSGHFAERSVLPAFSSWIVIPTPEGDDAPGTENQLDVYARTKKLIWAGLDRCLQPKPHETKVETVEFSLDFAKAVWVP